MQASGSAPRPVEVALRHEGYTVDEASLTRLVHALDAWPEQRLAPGELSLVLMTQAELADLHERFLDDPSPTDVITFAGDPEADFAGEICLSLDQAQIEADKRGHALVEEANLYLVHGWLHLAGLKDAEEADREAMRSAEVAALEHLKCCNSEATNWLRTR